MNNEDVGAYCHYDRKIRSDIERTAHQLWEAEGCPEGRDLDHWLIAEAQVLSLLEPGEPGHPTEEPAS